MSSQSDFRAAAQAYAAANPSHALVWSRPFAGKPGTATRPAIPQRDGTVWPIISGDCPQKFVILRGRRDT